MKYLDNDSQGFYRVDTETSSYIISPSARKGMRIPGDNAVELRKDGEWFKLAKILVCEVGQPMVLLATDINERLDMFTTRRTTNVVSIIESKGENK